MFKGEVSPHLASLIDDVEVDMNKVKKDLDEFSSQFDYTVIEGAGGLYCPAIKGNLFSDIIKTLNQEIIIVTTPHLGRLNHTLMTIECAKLNNIKIKGLIINKMPDNPTLSEANFTKELIRTSIYLRVRRKVTNFAAHSYLIVMKNHTLCAYTKYN